MKVSRRTVLTTSAGAVAFGKAIRGQAPQPVPSDPSKRPGRPSRALGQRSPFEKIQRVPRSASGAWTPHQDLMGTITPADLHFERHHAGVPQPRGRRDGLHAADACRGARLPRARQHDLSHEPDHGMARSARRRGCLSRGGVGMKRDS